jgi:hypothetical protein
VYRGGPVLSAVTVTSDGDVFAVGKSGGAHSAGATWVDDPGAKGTSVGSTTHTDVFAAGGPGDILRWDGVQWSRLSTIGANQPRVAVTLRRVFIPGTGHAVLLR